MLAISEDLKLFPKPFTGKKSQREPHLLHGLVDPAPSSNPCVAETQSFLLCSWCRKLAFSKISFKSGLGRKNKHVKWHIQQTQPKRLLCPARALLMVNPGWQLLHVFSHCCFPQLLKQKQDGAASEEGWSPSPQIEPGQGQELRSLHHLIEKVNKSKQHLIY